jgi:peptidase E
MNLILTSDFPSTPNDRVLARMRAVGPDPRIAWIPPFTDPGGGFFRDAAERFGALGFTQLECVDIDEDCDQVQIAYLHEFDIVYLSGGDPVRFRYNAMRSGLSGRLRPCLAAGRLVIGASGGALLVTPNVSVFRLQDESVDAVVAARARFEALGVVDYELLPHINRWDDAFLAKVRDYSSRIDRDIIGLPDGGAVLHSDGRIGEVSGAITRFRKGHIIDHGVES